MNVKAILNALKEIKDIVDKLKKAEIKVKKCNEILDIIKKIEDLLRADKVDELEAYRLMIGLLEVLSFLGEKVPLLDVFLELFIAALKSSLILIDTVLLERYSFHHTCEIYCKERKEHEDAMRDAGWKDEDEISKRGHDNAMSKMSNALFLNNEKEFKAQYLDFLHKLEIEELLKTAEYYKSHKKEIQLEAEEKEKKEREEEEKRREDEKRKKEIEKLRKEILHRIDYWIFVFKKIQDLKEKLKSEDLSTAEREKIEAEIKFLESTFSAPK